ncbi:thioesterase family protein [Tropicibacter sp. Alg240-R139]|uniref:thioesterase family protein n=1 Tax=Tropicibacter sp. Alg240-R139 TaxID=2305991 RepID=UPI0013E03B60|nr:thioesterase family protein [Tropicibacter sp. Alg240-R139]
MRDLSYFRMAADGSFNGNDPARGPWSPDHCHAGPVSGLVVRAAEAAAGPTKMLTRLTIDVLRPVPLFGLRINAEVLRDSRTLTTTRIEVVAEDGTVCATATTMHLVRKTLSDVPTATVQSPRFEDAEPGESILIAGIHDKPMFGNFTEMAFPKGQSQGPGPKTVWVRVPKLITGEDQNPIQSVCALADCGNGLSMNEVPRMIGFMNTDLTLQVHREPESDWLASDSVSHWHDNGVGMSHSTLYDTKGPIGVALQTLVLHPIK